MRCAATALAHHFNSNSRVTAAELSGQGSLSTAVASQLDTASNILAACLGDLFGSVYLHGCWATLCPMSRDDSSFKGACFACCTTGPLR